MSLRTLDKSKLKVKEIGITAISESTNNIQLVTLNDSLKSLNFLIESIEYNKNSLIATMTQDTTKDSARIATQKKKLNEFNQKREDYKSLQLKTEAAFNKEMNTKATRNDKIILFNYE